MSDINFFERNRLRTLTNKIEAAIYNWRASPNHIRHLLFKPVLPNLLLYFEPHPIQVSPLGITNCNSIREACEINSAKFNADEKEREGEGGRERARKRERETWDSSGKKTALGYLPPLARVNHVISCTSNPTNLTLRDLWTNPCVIVTFLKSDSGPACLGHRANCI